MSGFLTLPARRYSSVTVSRSIYDASEQTGSHPKKIYGILPTLSANAITTSSYRKGIGASCARPTRWSSRQGSLSNGRNRVLGHKENAARKRGVLFAQPN